MPMKSSCTSRKRATRPLIKYSLWPERYSRRPTTTSPGFNAIAGFSARRFFHGFFLSASAAAWASASAMTIASGPLSVSLPTISTNPSSLVTVTGPGFSTSAIPLSAGPSSGASRTLATASVNSGSTSVSVTSASPNGGRLAVPLNMQSDIRSARNCLWLCSPSTHEIASTTFDLPQPFGPTMHVIPLPLNVIGVFSKKDLKPNNSTLRSFSTQPSQDSLLPLHRRKTGYFSNFRRTFRDKNVGGSNRVGPTAWRYRIGGYGK